MCTNGLQTKPSSTYPITENSDKEWVHISYNEEGLPTVQELTPRTSNILEPTVDCVLNRQQTGSFPDNGAPANFLSKSFADRLGIPINTGSSRTFRTGIGKAFQTLGTVMVPFSFKEEKELHLLEFHVMSKALRDIVLGGPFLKATETFSRFKHRVTRKFRHKILPQLCYVRGSHQGILGYFDGELVEAVPDTGSDILAISTEYARKRSLHIDESDEHRIEIAFADGSTAVTRGIVKDVAFEFASSPTDEYRRDFYVLDDLDCDVVLDYEFLDETDAFSFHEDSFVENLIPYYEESASFFTITRAHGFVESAKDWFRGGPKQNSEGKSTILSMHTSVAYYY